MCNGRAILALVLILLILSFMGCFDRQRFTSAAGRRPGVTDVPVRRSPERGGGGAVRAQTKEADATKAITARRRGADPDRPGDVARPVGMAVASAASPG